MAKQKILTGLTHNEKYPFESGDSKMMSYRDFRLYVCMSVCMLSDYPNLLIHYLTDRDETYNNR